MMTGAYRVKNGKWIARMTRQGKRYNLGTFNTELDAHMAYTRAMADELGYIRVPLKVARFSGVGTSAIGKLIPGLGIPHGYDVMNSSPVISGEWFAIIDPQDADKVFGKESTEWYVKRLHSASPLVFAVNDKGEKMGDFIMKTENIRHLNYNGLDCRRRNMRMVPKEEATDWQQKWHLDNVIADMKAKMTQTKLGEDKKSKKIVGVTKIKCGKFVARAPSLAHLVARREASVAAGTGSGATAATGSVSPSLQKYLGIHATIEGAVAAVKQYEDLTAMALAWMDAGSPEVITEDVWESIWAASKVDKELRAVAASLDDDSGLPALVVFVRRELGTGTGDLSIGEAAARLGVKPHVLRQMERTGALVPAGRSRGYWPGSGHRRYTEEQVEEMRRRMG